MSEMILVERQLVKRHNKNFSEIDHLAFLSKNLYNSTLYAVKQAYRETETYKNYFDLSKEFTHSNQPDYRALPAKVSKMTMQLVDKTMKSFFALLRAKKKGSYDTPVHLPHYLDKNGRQVVFYTKQALSFQKKGFIRLSKTNIYIPTNRTKSEVQFVRLIPRGNHYIVEIGYKVSYQPSSKEMKNIVSIDLGINNLMAVGSNTIEPFLVSGRPVKSINQFYNKKIAKQQSKLRKGVHTSDYIQNLWRRRNDKITDYFHKVTTKFVSYLVSNKIDTLIIGENKGWKQDINCGHVMNQKFCQIPFDKLKQMLKYKAELKGIQVIFTEESYTSKASFLDKDEIPKFDAKHKYKFSGKRIKRGLYKTKLGHFINADLNGALNILKKGLKVAWNDQLWSDCVGACSTPNLQKISVFC